MAAWADSHYLGRVFAGKRLTTLILTAGLALIAAAPAGATTLPSGFAEADLTTGFLNSPTAAAFAPDGRRFLTEKGGRVRVVSATGAVRSTPLLDLTAKVNSYSDRGMLGIATDKDFATNGYLYLLYVAEVNPMVQDASAPTVSRLTRVTVRPDNTLVNPSNPETVILGTDANGTCEQPDNARDCIPADYYWHTIGTVRSDPVDGTLWVGNGDAHPHAVNATSYRPYDEQTLAGKIMHIDRNGRGLPGHPFCPTETDLTKTCTKIYAKGFRNPFRFTLRPGKGPVVGDVGASDREEIDLIKPGQNYGWPCYEGTVRTPLYRTQSRCLQEYAKEGTAAAHTPPNWDYAHADGASTVGGAVYNGTRYPADYRGDIFVGDYVQGWVKRLDVDSSDRVTAVHDFASNWPTGVEIQSAPGDGDIAYTDLGWGGSGAIRSFRYSGATNAPPVAKAAATPTSGTPPLAVSFYSVGSSDPDGDTLSYSWDFGDGTAMSTAANPAHTYTTAGNYVAQLTVSDGQGNTDTETVTISVGNSGPTASITAPVDESSYRDGGTVTVRGSGTDPEDGALPESAYSWQVLLHHGSHLHEHTTATGSQFSFVTAIDHDADSYYEIKLTVTDSGGLKHTSSVDVRPQTSKLTLASSPAGAPLDYIGFQSGAAPFTRDAAIGYRATIAAAETFVKDGVTYRFSAWSDGGARQHEVTVPASDSTLTANYVPDTGTETLKFTPEADTWVDATRPTTSFGTSSQFEVDTSPQSQSYLRFRVAGIAGRQVRAVRLRMFQRDASRTGGRVFSMSSNSWLESMTWNTRPAIDGSQLAEFGAVSAGNWYEVPLAPGAVSADGLVSLGLDSASSDGSTWGSRTYTNKPELQVDVGGAANRPPVAQAAGTPLSGTAPLAVGFSSAGSSDPDGDTLSYSWQFGDGTPNSTAANPSHTYTTPGTYTATLTVNDGKGNSDSKTVAVEVRSAGAETLTFTPEADTWVDATRPTTSFGTSSQFEVDTSPQSQSYLRFRVAGIAGRQVRAVRLRMFQRDASRTGGRVFSMSSNSWLESMTWNTRAAIDGAKLAEFGAVSAGNWYEVLLAPGAVSADGLVSLGLDSASSDGATWGSRTYANKPQLLVGVE